MHRRGRTHHTNNKTRTKNTEKGLFLVLFLFVCIALGLSIWGVVQSQKNQTAIGMLPEGKRTEHQCFRFVQCSDTNKDGICQADEPVISEQEWCVPEPPEMPQENITINQQRIVALDSAFVETTTKVHTLELEMHHTHDMHSSDVNRLDGVDHSTLSQTTSLHGRVGTLEQLDIAKQTRLQYLHNNLTQHHARLIALENGLELTSAPFLNETWTTQLDEMDAHLYQLETQHILQHTTLQQFNQTQQKFKEKQSMTDVMMDQFMDNITTLSNHIEEDAAMYSLLHQEDLTLHMHIAWTQSNLTALNNAFSTRMIEVDALKTNHDTMLIQHQAQAQQLQHIATVMADKQLQTQQMSTTLGTLQEQTGALLGHINALQQVEQQYQTWKAGTSSNISTLQSTVNALLGVQSNGAQTDAQLTATVNQLHTTIGSHDARLATIEGHANALQSNYATQNTTLHVMNGTMSQLLTTQSGILGHLTNVQAILDARGLFIQQFQTQSNQTVTSLQQSMAAMDERTNDLAMREAIVESDVAVLQTNYATLQQRFNHREADQLLLSNRVMYVQQNQTIHNDQIESLQNHVHMLDERTRPWVVLSPQIESKVGALEDWRLVVDTHLSELVPLEQEMQYLDVAVTDSIRQVNTSCVMATGLLQQQVNQLSTSLDAANAEIARLEEIIHDHNNDGINDHNQHEATLQTCSAGHIHHNGQVLFSHGLTATRTALGRYTIVFDTALSHNKYPVFIQVEEEAGNTSLSDDIQAHVIDGTRQTTGFSLHIVRQDKGGKNNPFYEDRAFSVQVLCVK